MEYPLHTNSIKYVASRLRFLYDRHMSDKAMKVYLFIIPDKNYFIAEKNGYTSIDYEKLISDI